MHDRYLDMDAHELAAEEAVQAYALAGERAAEWEAYLGQHPDLAVRILAACRLLTEAQAYAAETAEPTGADVERVWRGIAARTKPEARVVGMRAWVREGRWGRIAAAAAAAVLLLVGTLVLSTPGEVYATRRGETEAVDLPDGTRVVLAPESSLRVRDYEADGRRVVVLRGRGFFEVAKGAPFTVETPAGEVAVLGTSFEVEARDGRFAVACATGRVRVSRGGASAVLTPGEAVAGARAVLTPVERVEPAEVAAWRTGTLRYEDAPLPYIADELARHYARPFGVAEGLRERRLTLSAPADDFPELVRRLEYVLRAQVDTSGLQVELR